MQNVIKEGQISCSGSTYSPRGCRPQASFLETVFIKFIITYFMFLTTFLKHCKVMKYHHTLSMSLIVIFPIINTLK